MRHDDVLGDRRQCRYEPSEEGGGRRRAGRLSEDERGHVDRAYAGERVGQCPRYRHGWIRE